MASTISSEQQTEAEIVCHSALTGHSNLPDTGCGSSLQVNVLFTKPKATLSALNVAGKLAENLGARIRLIVPQIVPFPLQLGQPPIDAGFTAEKVRALLASSEAEAEIQVCLCREPLDAALAVLRPHSLLLLGGRRRLWPTEDSRLFKQIQRHGHQVLFVAEG